MAKDSRVTKCLTAKHESSTIEFKEKFDPTDPRESLEVLKDIVAIANSGGGTIAIGINNDGEGCRCDAESVINYDHAKYCDLVKKYTMQNFAEFKVIEAKKDGHTVAIFLISPPDSPLVFEKPGTNAIPGNKQTTAFSQGTVYFRHGAKSEPGSTDDIRKFINKRAREMQQSFVKGMKRFSEAPRGSKIQIVPRGAMLAGRESALPVRITKDVGAREAIVLDRDQAFRYRQKDVIEQIKEALPKGPIPNGFDLNALNRVFNVAANEVLSWKPQFSSRQYSDAYVSWIMGNIKKDKDFLQNARTKYKEINKKKS